MERSLNGLPRSKCKWKEYLKTRCDREWKIRWERWPCPLQGEAGACMVISFGGWGDCDSDRLTFLPADFKRWWRFCLACRLLPRLVYLSAVIGFDSVLILLFLSSSSFFLLKVKVKVAQSCLTLCDPMDSTVHGILQARTLEWVAFPFSRGSSQPRDLPNPGIELRSPALQADFLPAEPPGKPFFLLRWVQVVHTYHLKCFTFKWMWALYIGNCFVFSPVGNLEGDNLHWCGT